MLKIAIVEDESKYAESLKDFVKRYGEEKGLPIEATHFKDGMDFLEHLHMHFDIVFMDVQMPMIDGMETAKRLRRVDENMCLIFITNFAQYAINGYEVAAMDFMIKPVAYADLRYRLDKAMKQVGKTEEEEIALTFGRQVRRIKISDIYYVEVKLHKLLYHTTAGDIEVFNSLAKAEKELPESEFCKCNSCYLVNLRYVTKIDGNSVYVGKEELIVSRPKRRQFIDALTLYMGKMKKGE